jgi:hypothetical protein
MRGVILPVLAALAFLAPEAGHAAPTEREAALLYLHAHNVDLNYGSLADAIGRADDRTVLALIDAGLAVGDAGADRTEGALISGLTIACAAEPVRFVPLNLSVDALAEHGFPIAHADALGNTVLLSAAQYCPTTVVEHLLARGAPVDPMNRQKFTPLMMAFVGGKWDVAKLLVDHGARVTRQQADELFFEKPQDPDQRALLDRATR